MRPIVFLLLTMFAFLLFLPLIASLGCQRREESSRNQVFAEDESEFVLLVVVDLSGSFESMMANDGAAYDFTLYAIDHFMRDRAGFSDQLILAQVSGTNRSLLWQGSPRRLQEEFPTPESFRDFLLSKKDPNGSLIHDGINHAMSYVVDHRAVQAGKAKTATLVLSDFIDNGPEPEKSEERLMATFKDYLNEGGAIGLYYVDQMEHAKWRKNFDQAGFESCVLEMDIHGRPALPEFEE